MTKLDVFKLGNTVGANVFILVLGKLRRAAAKMANRNILCKNYLVILDVYFYWIGVGYSQLFAQLLGNDNSSKLINVSDYSGGFHFTSNLSLSKTRKLAILLAKQFYHKRRLMSSFFSLFGSKIFLKDGQGSGDF
jgi:hypothetical protein